MGGSNLEDWERKESAHPAERLTFFVALLQRNVDQLEVSLFVHFNIDH